MGYPKDSIKAAAKLVAANLWTMYHGNEPGQIPGILPGPPDSGRGPYYWWQAGAMWGTLVDYWFYTGDDTYNAEAMRSMVFQAEAPGNAYMPRNWTASLGNDDQGFWGMAALGAAEVNFPNPPADQPQWLALAQAVFNTQFPRWELEYCNGGMRWQVERTNGGYDYKNTIANGVFMNIAARLARYTGNDTYTFWVDKAWDWLEGVGYITETWDVLDGGHIGYNCTDVNRVQFSANAAILIHATAIMYNYVSVIASFLSFSLVPLPYTTLTLPRSSYRPTAPKSGGSAPLASSTAPSTTSSPTAKASWSSAPASSRTACNATSTNTPLRGTCTARWPSPPSSRPSRATSSPRRCAPRPRAPSRPACPTAPAASAGIRESMMGIRIWVPRGSR